MKHIKQFEANEMIKWRNISSEESNRLREANSMEIFTIDELANIKYTMNKMSVFSIRYFGYDKDNKWDEFYKPSQYMIKTNSVVITLRDGSMVIADKFSDDYFFVIHLKGASSKYEHILCDEFEGLINYLEHKAQS